MGYGAIIREIRKSKVPKMTAKELAEKAGISPTFLSDIEREREGCSASIDTLKNIAKALEVPLSDILKFTPETEKRIEQANVLMDRLKELNIDISKLDKEIETLESRIVEVPIIGFVPAGGPVIVEENFEGLMPMPSKFVKDRNDFCLKVRGDSMEDVGIQDGDSVLVHPQPTAENGQTVIARINGEVTCKRFYKTDDKCILEPANSKYKPINCNEIEIIGIVTKVVKDIF